jgi:hypothetical protein
LVRLVVVDVGGGSYSLSIARRLYSSESSHQSIFDSDTSHTTMLLSLIIIIIYGNLLPFFLSYTFSFVHTLSLKAYTA